MSNHPINFLPTPTKDYSKNTCFFMLSTIPTTATVTVHHFNVSFRKSRFTALYACSPVASLYARTLSPTSISSIGFNLASVFTLFAYLLIIVNNINIFQFVPRIIMLFGVDRSTDQQHYFGYVVWKGYGENFFKGCPASFRVI